MNENSSKMKILSPLDRLDEVEVLIEAGADEFYAGVIPDGWSDEHDLSEPLTGAFFDSLVDIYHDPIYKTNLGEVDPPYHMDARVIRIARETHKIIGFL